MLVAGRWLEDTFTIWFPDDAISIVAYTSTVRAKKRKYGCCVSLFLHKIDRNHKRSILSGGSFSSIPE
jgi:hypothetical protein